MYDSPEYCTQHFAYHVHLGALEKLSALAEGTQDAVPPIVAHAIYIKKRDSIMLKIILLLVLQSIVSLVKELF